MIPFKTYPFVFYGLEQNIKYGSVSQVDMLRLFLCTLQHREYFMSQRLNYPELSADLFHKYFEFNQVIKQNKTAEEFNDLVTIRASQLNGCAFCLDMHIKQAKIAGERELRLHHLAVWHESPLFNEREKAALLWTEALTHLSAKGVSDEIYKQVRETLSEKEISDLSFLVILINGWNRLGVAFQVEPGSADAIYGLNKAGLN